MCKCQCWRAVASWQVRKQSHMIFAWPGCQASCCVQSHRSVHRSMYHLAAQHCVQVAHSTCHTRAHRQIACRKQGIASRGSVSFKHILFA
jgi:hypothetical protein